MFTDENYIFWLKYLLKGNGGQTKKNSLKNMLIQIFT